MVEVYSSPRIVAMAHRMGLRAGWVLDLTIYNETGPPWDLNCKQMRNAAVRKFLEDKPTLLIDGPMCGPFGTMNHLNSPNND